MNGRINLFAFISTKWDYYWWNIGDKIFVLPFHTKKLWISQISPASGCYICNCVVTFKSETTRLVDVLCNKVTAECQRNRRDPFNSALEFPPNILSCLFSLVIHLKLSKFRPLYLISTLSLFLNSVAWFPYKRSCFAEFWEKRWFYRGSVLTFKLELRQKDIFILKTSLSHSF